MIAGADSGVHYSAARLARQSNQSRHRQVGGRQNQRSRTVRARALARPVAWRRAANRAHRQGSRQSAGDAYRQQHACTGFSYVDVRRKLHHQHVAPCELRLVLASAGARRSETPSLSLHSLHFVAPNCLKSHRRMARERISALLIVAFCGARAARELRRPEPASRRAKLSEALPPVANAPVVRVTQRARFAIGLLCG